MSLLENKMIESKDDTEFLPIVINDSVLSKIYNYYLYKKINDTALSYGVYTFLYKTARIQNNIRVYATDTFIKQGTGLGSNKLKQIKRDLRDMALIESIRPRDKNGQYSNQFYIEVKYVWKAETLEKLFYQENDSTTRYKIARELLLNNFNDCEEISIFDEDFYFEASLNGYEVSLVPEYFYYENKVLKCYCSIYGEDTYFDYTVPKKDIGEIVINLANRYKFNFRAIEKVLNS